MINSLIRFPIWKDDGKQVVNLKEYQFIDNPCLCGNKDNNSDILIAQKDRYGISCDNVLCKKCGLIRLKERLDDYSNAEFYKNEYRDIYVGKDKASDEFFNSQSSRGEIFYKLIEKYTNMKDISTVFEIGCGAGGILFPFYQNGKEVSGCDFGEKYLKLGQDKGINLYKGEVDKNKSYHTCTYLWSIL